MLYKKKWTLKHFGKIKENKVGTQIGISPEISQILKNTNYIHEFKGTSDIEDVNNLHIENKNVSRCHWKGKKGYGIIK